MRILIIKTSALGDIVHALPTLAALRRAMPEATLGWVVEDVFRPLLDGHPDLDFVLPVRTRAWRRISPLRSIPEISAFVRSLQAFGPDVALDLMGNHKAGVIAALSLADRRIGIQSSSRRETSSSLWMNESVPAAGQHAVERNLAMLEGLGIDARTPDFSSVRLFRQPSPVLDLPADFILIHPGAGWGNKRYPPPSWGEVANAVSSRLQLQVLIASGPGEEELAEEVARHSEGTARPVFLPTIPALGEALRRARLVMAGDTGPMHLAHALGTPTLAVMGPTNPLRHGPYAAVDQAIVHRLPCSFCYRRFDEAKACLLEISPDLVTERAVQLLQPSA